MATSFNTVRLGEVAEFRNGLNFSKASRGKGCTLIGIPDFQNRFSPDYDNLSEIDPAGIAKADDYLQKGDILFVRSNGNKELVGRSLFINRDIKALFSGFCIRARIFVENIDPTFCAYFTKTKSFRASITGHAVTSINNLNQGILADIELPGFSLAHQKAVASVLTALDAKIELNQRINEELEGMAKLLYDYWFVQFDFPMTAAQAAALGKPKLTGKPYRASGGKMVYNQTLKRDIPEGWEVCTVGEILAKEVRAKNVLSSKILDKGRIPVVDQGSAFICGFTDDEESIIKDTPKIVFGDHTRILKFINFPFARGADGTQILTSLESRLPQHLFYYQLLSVDLSSYGYARHFKFLKDQKVILPDEDAANAFERIASSMYAKIKNNIFQNQELTQLRDWLLPMLMNGQVTVGRAGA